MDAPNSGSEYQNAAPIPHTFVEYLRSFGPGLVVVLTWLGAGDIVDMGIAGGNYGYSLMWVLVLAVIMRFFFVSLIAKYQLCNQHGEGVLDGLVRLHRGYGPSLWILHDGGPRRSLSKYHWPRVRMGLGTTRQWSGCMYCISAVVPTYGNDI